MSESEGEVEKDVKSSLSPRDGFSCYNRELKVTAIGRMGGGGHSILSEPGGRKKSSLASSLAH